ncbi:MAG TPA: arginine--tRNA ligase [Candidatus Saccharimonadales bacterium]|nr:arginine--tRNA ligase [Candidatus Saccharimonadales bacterium]
MKEEINKKLEEIVKKLTNEDVKVQLTVPIDSKNGDYSSNVAMQLYREFANAVDSHVPGGGKQGINWRMPKDMVWNGPISLAELIVSNWQKLGGINVVATVEAVKPGFINFYLSQEALKKNIEEVLSAPEKVGKTTKFGKGRKAVVEYSSPNIAKPFTIGHLRSTIIGDAVANLLNAVGYEVYRDNHLGDWGTQFGKQIYAVKNIPLDNYPEGSDIERMNEEKLNKSENPVKDLVALYVKFHEEAEKNPQLEEEARHWFKKLEEGDEEARRLWKKCIDWSFKEFDRIYKELEVKFTENNERGYGESFFEDKMQPVIAELREKGLLKKDKGAELIFFPADKFPPLMVIKSDGATLYATRDLATDKFRLSHYGEDVLVINEVGAEQSLYWKQIFETEYMVGWYKPGQRVHVGHGLYRFKEGKMSTRKGNVIWLEDVLNEAFSRASKLTKHSLDIEGDVAMTISSKRGSALNNGMVASELLKSTKKVAIGALKWNDLKRSAHLDVTFDWDEILSMQGNSGPYVQYSYVRTQSILGKAGIGHPGVVRIGSKGQDSSAMPQNDKYNFQKEELDIERKLVHFSEIVEAAANTYSPNVVCEYLFELAQLFNNFYQKYRIINAATEEEKAFRLQLTAAVGIILKQGLNLLGIQAPEKM